jgi:hypothetical protein
MLFGFLVAPHADKKRSRVLYRLALLAFCGAVLTFIFLRGRYNLSLIGEAPLHLSLRIALTAALCLLALVLFTAGVYTEPEMEVNTKQVFAANTTDLTVELTYPAGRFITVRWEHVKEILHSRNESTFRLLITSDYIDLEESADGDVLLIDDICLSKATPGFALLCEFTPASIKPSCMRIGTGKKKSGHNRRNKKRRKKTKAG